MSGETAYRLIRSRRKTVSLEITRELEILVRAPMRMSQTAINTFVDKNRGWIADKLERRRRYLQKYPEPTPEEIRQLRQRAKAELPDRVAYYSGLMDLTPTGITITAARTRFGSCSGADRISFSCLLMRYPQEAIDYVVVHELAHIRHKNHSSAFYRAVEEILPDYRSQKALLSLS